MAKKITKKTPEQKALIGITIIGGGGGFQTLTIHNILTTQITAEQFPGAEDSRTLKAVGVSLH